MELVVNSINKTIRGKVILSDVNLCLKSGNVYGIIGKNGSGKTMLFRALSGLMKVDSGSIVWNRKILHKDFSVLPSLGIIIENAGLYPNFTGIQNLTYLANLTKISCKFDKKNWAGGDYSCYFSSWIESM